MKPLVIYHADCTDGFGAAFAAWLKLGDAAEYLPMHYGFKPHEMPSFTDREVYMVDFSWPRDLMAELFEKANRVVWLDHHKTAFEAFDIPLSDSPAFICATKFGVGLRFNDPDTIEHYCHLNNDKSGALLAWEYFHPGTEVPMLIQHIDDRDRWQFKLEGSKELHAALASYKPWSFEQWREYISPQAPTWLIDEGAAILRAQDQHVASMVKHARECRMDIGEGDPTCYRAGLAVNATMHISEVGHELANSSGTFGLIWYVGNDNRAKCSLRSNGDYDVSTIAKAFGGGGHQNAAGFETDIDMLMGWLK